MKDLVSPLLVVAIAVMVITTQPTPTQAVDIQGFDSATACEGSGYTFNGIAERTCTDFGSAIGSVQIRGLTSCQTGVAYSGGTCTTATLSGNGPDVRCFIGGSYTGAQWINNCRRRKLQAAPSQTSECTSLAAPTGVHYTEFPAKGSWILHTSNATDVMELLRAIEDAEKVEWLKARGAHFTMA